MLVMAALSGFAKVAVLDGLLTPGDAAATARDVVASEGMFRLATGVLMLVAALDVVVAWALLEVFRPVNAGLSMLAAWFRLAYAAVFMVAISELVGALGLLTDPASLRVFNADQAHTQALVRVDAFTNTWDAGLILFGVSLILIGYLAYRSGYVPRILAVLIVIAGVGYFCDSLIAVTSGPTIKISSFTFVGEFLLAVWLVARGRQITLSRASL